MFDLYVSITININLLPTKTVIMFGIPSRLRNL